MKGIIMSGDHPRKCMDGTKTQTRRVIKLKGYHRNVWEHCVPHNGETTALLGEPYLKVPYDEITDNAGTRITCPYGQVGDRLWVRETWAYNGSSSGEKHSSYVTYLTDGSKNEIEFNSFKEMVSVPPHQNFRYPANFDNLEEYEQEDIRHDLATKWWKSKKKIPSIHMPRWASRITLEITEVRVERVQEISEQDAIAEGITDDDVKRPLDANDESYDLCYADAFKRLWDSLNAKRGYGWEANPWVWCLSFKLIK